jgi:hypothetical protein
MKQPVIDGEIVLIVALVGVFFAAGMLWLLL